MSDERRCAARIESPRDRCCLPFGHEGEHQGMDVAELERIQKMLYGGDPQEIVAIPGTREFWVGIIGSIHQAEQEYATNGAETDAYMEDARMIAEALGLPKEDDDGG